MEPGAVAAAPPAGVGGRVATESCGKGKVGCTVGVAPRVQAAKAKHTAHVSPSFFIDASYSAAVATTIMRGEPSAKGEQA